LLRVFSHPNQIAEYTYNGAGQRIKKVTQTETRIFHYDLRGYLIAETNQTGQMLAEYVYLGDQILSMIKPGESVYYYHNDHLGTPQVLTNDSQAISWKAVYTPFGDAVPSVQTVENPFRFPGQYYDTETGLHYNYFRYYNPQTGRYITPDPIGLEGGINLFAYVRGNPLRWIDRKGLVDPTGIGFSDSFMDEVPPGLVEYWSGFGEGLSDFWTNYQNMKNANTIGADKYFHCMANCEAVRRGEGGSDVAKLLSEGRELFDEYIKRDLRWACNQDRAANKQGQRGDPTKPCKDVCKSLRPRGLPSKY
jgi:RHS repeat-associated protein